MEKGFPMPNGFLTASDIRENLGNMPSGGGGNQGGSGGGGGIGAYLSPGSRFTELYNRIYQQNNGNFGLGGQDNGSRWSINQDNGNRWSIAQDEEYREDNSIFGDKSRENMQYRDPNDLDRAFLALKDTAEAISGLSGFQPKENQFFGEAILENPGGFLAQLPLGMIAAPLDAAAGAYSAISGSPIFDEKNEKGQIPDYEMTPLQKFGAAGSAAIDAIGSFYGGTGRVVGAGIRAGREGLKALGKTVGKDALEGSKAGDRMARGWIKEAFDSNLGQFAGDVGEEAGEEAVQSVFEDMRGNNLDSGSLGRAANAAGYGAIGGAVFSGAGKALNKAVDKVTGSSLDASDNQPLTAMSDDDVDKGVYTSTFEEDREELREAGREGRIVTQAAKEEYNKGFTGARRDQIASGNYRHTKGDGTLGIDEAIFGTQNFENLWGYSQKNREFLSNRLNSSEDEVTKAVYRREFNGRTYNSTKAALNALYKERVLDQNNGLGITVVIGRDPATKNGGFKVRLKGFSDGEYMAVNPMAWSLVGADVDGDTSGVFFDADKFNVNGYASEMWLDPEGKSNFDFDFSGFGSRLVDTNHRLKHQIERIEDDYDLTKGYFDRLVQANQSENRDADIASTMNDMMSEIRERRASGTDQSGKKNYGGMPSHTTVMNNLVRDILLSDESLIAVGYNNAQQSAIDEINEELEELEELKDDPEVQKAVLEVLYGDGKSRRILTQRGTTGGATRPAQILDAINEIIFATVDKGNPRFRQHGYNKYLVSGERSVWTLLGKATRFLSKDSIFTTIIRTSFKLSEMGQDPITAIDGMIELFTINRVYSKYGGHPRISTEEDLNRFLEEYFEAYNYYTKLYNKVREERTNQGDRLPFDMPQRSPIEKVKKDKKGKKGEEPLWKNVQLARAFKKTFKDIPLDEWVDVSSLSEAYEGRTLNSVMSEINAVNGKFSMIFVPMEDQSMQRFLNTLQDTWYSDRHAAAENIKSIDRTIDDSGTISRYNKNGKSMDGHDYKFLVEVTQAVQRLIGVKNALRAGLQDPETAIKTKIGRMIYIGGSDKRLSAVISLNMREQFDPIIRDLSSKDMETVNNALMKLASVSEVSFTHAMICNELAECVKGGRPVQSYVLNMVSNFDLTLSEKEQYFKDIGKMHPGANLLIDCLSSTECRFDEGGISQKRTAYEQSITTARKHNFDRMYKEIETFETYADDIEPSLVESFVDEAGMRVNTTFNHDLAGVMVYDAAGESNKEVEKPTIQDSAVHYFASMEYARNGGLSSFLDALMAFKNGWVPLDVFSTNRILLLKCIIDPTFEIEVMDSMGRHKTMNQQVLFSESGIELGGAKPGGKDYIALMKEYPQLCGYLCETHMQPSKIGGMPQDTPVRDHELKDEFVNWLGGERGVSNESLRKDVQIKSQIEDGIARTEVWLASQSWYYPYIVRTIPNIDSLVKNPSRLCQIVTEQSRKAASAMFYLAQFDTRGNRIAEFMREFRFETESDALQIANSLIETARAETLDFQLEPDEFVKTVTSALSHQSGRMLYSQALLKRANDFAGSKNIRFDSFSPDQGSSFANVLSVVVDRAVEKTKDIVANLQYDTITAINDHLNIIIALASERFEIETERDLAFTPEDNFRQGAIENLAEQYKTALTANSEMDESQINVEVDKLRDALNEVKTGDGIGFFDVSKITLGNSDFSNRDSYVAKLRGIYEMCGEEFVLEKAEDEFKEFQDGKTGMEALKNKYFNMVITSELEKLNFETDIGINPNMYGAMKETVDGICDAVLSMKTNADANKEAHSIQQALNESGDRYDDVGVIEKFMKENGYETKLPKANFVNKTAEAVCSNLKIMLGSSSSPLSVNLNGGYTKKAAGFGFLPSSVKTSIPPDRIPVSEVIRRYDDDVEEDMRQWNVIVRMPGQSEEEASTTRVLGAIIDDLRNLEDQTTEVQLFDPNRNPHGFDDLYIPAPFAQAYREYHRPSGVFSRIFGESQEGMVLKKKKNLKLVTEIVNRKYFGKISKTGNISDESDLDNPGVAREMFANMFMEGRRDWMRDLEPTFSKGGELAGLGYGMDQIRLIVQVLTPGIKIELDDGSSVMLDAKYILGSQEAFAKRYGEITANGERQVVKAKMMFLTPELVSTRIETKVTKAFRDSQNGKMSSKGVRRTALEAVNDWSDFQFNNLPVSEVMRQVDPLGYSYKVAIPTADSPTAHQRLSETTWDGNARGTTMPTYNPKTEEITRKEELEIRKKILGKFFNNSDDYTLVKTWVPKEEPGFFGFDTERLFFGFGEKARQITNEMYTGENEKHAENGIGMVLDPNKLADAMKWGVRTGNMIAVPKNVLDNSNITISSGAYVGKQESNNVDDMSEQRGYFIFINPSLDNVYKNVRTFQATSSKSFLDPAEIHETYVDDEDTYQLADAHIGVTPAGRNIVVNRDGDIDSLSGRKLLNDKDTPFSLLSRKGLKQKLEGLIDNDGEIVNSDPKAWIEKGWNFQGYDKVGNNSVYSIQRAIASYYMKVANDDKNADGILREGVGHQDCIAIVSSADGSKVAPIILPDNVPELVSRVELTIRGDDITIGWTSEFSFANDTTGTQTIKMSLEYGYPFKGMASLIDTSRYPLPMVDLGDGMTVMPAFIDSAKSEGSRLPGLDMPIFKRMFHYFVRKYGLSKELSCIFEKDPNNEGKYRVKEHITRQFEALGKPDAVYDLISNERDAWRYIETGEVNLFPVSTGSSVNGDPNIKRNRIARNIVRRCRKYNINCVYMFSGYTVDNSGDAVTVPVDYDFNLAMDDMSQDDVLRFYHGFGSNLCPDGLNGDGRDTIFDKHGRVFVSINGERKRRVVRFGTVDTLGYDSFSTVGSAHKRESMQHMYVHGLDNGYMNHEMAEMIRYAEFQQGNPKYLDEVLRSSSSSQDVGDRPRAVSQSDSEYDLAVELVDSVGLSWREILHNASVAAMGRSLRYPRQITENQKKMKDPENDREIVKAMHWISSQSEHAINYTMVAITTSFNDGASANEGRGKQTVSKANFIRSIDAVTKSLRENYIPVSVPQGGRTQGSERYAVAGISPDIANWYFDNMEYIRNHWTENGTLSDEEGRKRYHEAIEKEMDKSEKAISEMSRSRDFSKKKALTIMCEWSRQQWGQKTQLVRLIGDHWVDELIANDEKLELMFKGDPSIDSKAFRELCNRQEELLSNFRDRADKLSKKKRAPVPWAIGGQAVTSRYDDGKAMMNIFDALTTTSQALAMMHPELTVSNCADRAIHQGMQNFALHLGHGLKLGKVQLRGVGPYKSKYWLDQDIVNVACNDELLVELYVSFRMAEFSGQEVQFLSAMNSAEDVREWVRKRNEGLSKASQRFQKVVLWAYKWGTGGEWFIKGQIRNFINRFAMLAEETGQEFWFDKVDGEDGEMTYLESRLATERGAGRWFIDIMGGNHGKTASLEIALRAMNWAKEGDLAQRNLPGMFFSSLVEKIPISRFIVVTGFMRFPNFTFNMTGRMLKWVMPLSSINYVAIEIMKGTKWGERNNVGTIQNMANLKEAMLVDMAHFGLGIVASILVGVAGLLQPPDDDDKKGNPGEWLIFGQRIADIWWVQDILGPALPLACFWISATQGAPRLDILMNGLSEVCYNNPMTGIGEILKFILDPMGSVMAGYDDEAKAFEKAPGGSPTPEQYFTNNFMNGAFTWAAQFATPSIVKDFYKKFPTNEKSYKRIYKKGEPHTILNTERVSYDEAKRRQITKNNWIWALIFETMNDTGTSYFAAGMPDTVYYSEAQLESMEHWSVKGLDDTQKQARAAEIISILQQYNDMDELKKTGFYLDNETKQVVSEMIWDIYHEYDEWYYGLQSEGLLDNYVLGDGDWNKGAQIKADIVLQWKQGKQAWNDFYNEKIKNSYLSQPMQIYTRYNTSYSTDANGDIYATGYRNSLANLALPIQLAPGTYTEPQGTAGYENDFNSVDIVTGEPMSQRALSPVPLESQDWPDFKEWSGDKNGNTYSKSYQNTYGIDGYGNSMTTPTTTTTTSSRRSSSGGGSYGSRSYGGRSYGGGSYGGGGGGSYSPNLYSRINMPNMPSMKSYNGDRNQRSDLDYLRPSFETKGSREAYRREDI